ncbi:MAG TPA: YihY/virulence factor BrkB family protein [Bryobacteraceae bacterium]|nr:YihY/virulence factor BrkB family protein [Bryobacteraceae bacterium]
MANDTPPILEAGGTEVSTRAGGARRYRKPLRCFRWEDIRILLSESLSEWTRQKGSRLGASLAFYTLLSLAPLLLVVVSIGGLVFGEGAAENHLVQQIRDLVGPEGARATQLLLSSARNTTHGAIATAIGLLTLLFGASGVLLELRDALNTIWEVSPAPGSGLRSIVQLIKDRLFSFALVLSIGFLLLVSLVVNAWIAAAGAYFAGVLPLPEALLHVINGLVSFAIITALFGAIYKVFPEARLEWRDVLLGAAVTSILFTIGKTLIGLYLGKASFVSTYGAAASVVILVVWVYYSGQVFFLGAEFTKVFTRRYGSQPGEPVAPTPSPPHPAGGAPNGSKLITPSSQI